MASSAKRGGGRETYFRCAEREGEEVTRESYLGSRQFDLQKLWYERRAEAAPWFTKNASSTYNYAQVHFAQAFANYFAGRTRVPKFKSKGRAESFTLAGGSTRLVDSHHVRLSRIGDIKTYESMRKLHRHLERGSARILSVTVVERGGTYTLAFTAEMSRVIPAPRPPERVIGIDVGLTTLYTGATPDGTQVLAVANPRHYQRRQARLARAQRVASRRRGPRKGVAPSNRWRRANQRVQNVHADITNARKNLIHETTTMLTKNYDRIIVEDLNVKGMLKNHSLAKHISDAAWGEFVRQLEYKAPWYGSTVVKADRFFPSSKTCTSCGAVKAKLPLEIRTYHCEACGLTLDRDHNAAVNLARWTSQPTSAGTPRGWTSRGGKTATDSFCHGSPR
ncbi:MAG: RNA-guided endonuclease InsQ/TnpB family protein [Acidimicrobiales bacterium]